MNTHFVRCGPLNLMGAGLLVLVACTTPEETTHTPSQPSTTAPIEAPSALIAPKPIEKPQVVRPTPRPTKPMPVVPLNVVADCKFHNETGYNGETTLEVREGTVRRMRTVVNVPEQGQCVFELADMQQTKIMPSVELHGRQTACTVRIWEQGRQVTLSFSSCAARCTPHEAFAYVWPVLIDKPSGKCE